MQFIISRRLEFSKDHKCNGGLINLRRACQFSKNAIREDGLHDNTVVEDIKSYLGKNSYMKVKYLSCC